MHKDMSEYICIRKEEKLIKQCYVCGGITNSCGFYQPKNGDNPFRELIENEKEIIGDALRQEGIKRLSGD
jgi:hypothetical protein